MNNLWQLPGQQVTDTTDATGYRYETIRQRTWWDASNPDGIVEERARVYEDGTVTDARGRALPNGYTPGYYGGRFRPGAYGEQGGYGVPALPGYDSANVSRYGQGYEQDRPGKVGRYSLRNFRPNDGSANNRKRNTIGAEGRDKVLDTSTVLDSVVFDPARRKLRYFVDPQGERTGSQISRDEKIRAIFLQKDGSALTGDIAAAMNDVVVNLPPERKHTTTMPANRIKLFSLNNIPEKILNELLENNVKIRLRGFDFPETVFGETGGMYLEQNNQFLFDVKFSKKITTEQFLDTFIHEIVHVLHLVREARRRGGLTASSFERYMIERNNEAIPNDDTTTPAHIMMFQDKENQDYYRALDHYFMLLNRMPEANPGGITEAFSSGDNYGRDKYTIIDTFFNQAVIFSNDRIIHYNRNNPTGPGTKDIFYSKVIFEGKYRYKRRHVPGFIDILRPVFGNW